MSESLTERRAEFQLLLEVLLGESSRLLPFGAAVMEHLTYQQPTAARRETVEKIGSILRMLDEDDQEIPADLLRSDPALLASFFQNADLLPADAPQTGRVARAVHGALESLDMHGG